MNWVKFSQSAVQENIGVPYFVVNLLKPVFHLDKPSELCVSLCWR